jgi:hypothetical protein
MFLRNVGKLLLDYMALNPRSQRSENHKFKLPVFLCEWINLHQDSTCVQSLTHAWQSGFLQMLIIKTVVISNYAFIYGLFNDALKSSDNMASNYDN